MISFKTKRFIHIFSVLCITVSAFVFGMVYAGESGSDEINNSHFYTQVNTNNNTRLGTSAQIIYMKHFTESDSYSITYSPSKAKYTGMDMTQAAEEFAGWNVIYLDEDKLILQKDILSYGPQTYTISTIQKDDTEYVCVYSYDDNGEMIVYSVFDTPVDLFDEETINELKNGITVKGKDKLLSAMEAFDD